MDMKPNRGLADEVEAVLGAHHADSYGADELWSMKQQLMREGYVKLSRLLTPDLKDMLRQDVIRLTENASRRIDIKVETTDDSPRKMKTVNFTEISRGSDLISKLYYSSAIRAFLNTVSHSTIMDCEYENERMTITRQEQPGDTHGWHWGDYQWALIFIIEAPDVDAGGMLQCVPHTIWDKQAPQVARHLIENPIRSYHHATGDIYFFQTDTTLHRTYPLSRDCTRIILNFTFAGTHDLTRDHQHETMNQVYDF